MISRSRQISNIVLVGTLAAILLSAAIFMSSNPIQSANAQQPTPQQQQKAPLNIYLKLANNASTSQAASQSTANGNGTKNITIAVDIKKGPSGQLIQLPISAVVPTNIQPQDLQLCASLADGSESCQPLAQQGTSIDLTQASAGGTTTPTGTMTPMPAPALQSYPGDINEKASTGLFQPIVIAMSSAFEVQQAYAQLIGINNTTVNIPITVIVPIDINIQNAQICASVLSSGSQTCQQIVFNPTQTSYSPVDVNLAQPTPAVTTQEAAAPTTPAPTITTPSVTTTPQPIDQLQAQGCPPLCGPTSPATSTPGDQPEPTPMPPETTTEQQPSTSEDQGAEPTDGGSSGTILR